MPQKAGSEGSWCDYHGLDHIKEHGSPSTYSNHRCRCVPCTGAWARAHLKWCHDRARRVPPHVHGTENGYTNYRCRCERCKVGHREASAEKRRKKRADGPVKAA